MGQGSVIWPFEPVLPFYKFLADLPQHYFAHPVAIPLNSSNNECDEY